MAFFSGEYECKLDAKGRIVLPSKLKAGLPEAAANALVVSRGFEPCLVLYSMIEWNKILAKVSGLGEFSPEYRMFQRQFFGGNQEVELDSNGRFLIPKKLMQHASLDKDAVIVGVGNRMELWNPDLYEKYLIGDPQEFSNLAAKYLSDNRQQDK